MMTLKKGTKKSKERLTVVLACNAPGSIKLKSLIIGKHASPRCFKNKNIDKFEIFYKNSQNAWIT
jgi:hypothetical protein